MPKLGDHQSKTCTKMLFVGDSGCLTGDTIISMQRGAKPRKLTMREVFSRVNGKHFNKKQHDTFLLADLGGHAGMHKMHKIIKSGKKKVYELKTISFTIKASADHQFKTENGWLPLSNLNAGLRVATWRSARKKDEEDKRRGPGKGSTNSDRNQIYSIPYHPNGFRNWVAGRDYKRLPRARLIVEAAMNGIALEDFVRYLRTDPNKCLSFAYLSRDVDVHHKDENILNEELDNLEVTPRLEHIAHHHENKVKESKAIEWEEILSIRELAEEETYDVMMEAPFHNFIANGFVVHNSGKTGALASLAAADYKLHIMDMDNGLDVLKNLLTHPSSSYVKQNPQAAANVDFVTITDAMKNINGRLVPKTATAWTRAVKLIMDWQDGETKLGPITTWSQQDILVIDSLTMLSTAALNFILSMNGRLGQRPHQSDWGDGQTLIEGMLQGLYDEGVQCNVIVNCHLTFIGEDGGPLRGYPNTLGKALPPKVGRYFNTALMARTTGQGTMQKRKILTNTSGIIELKNTAPMLVQAEYPLDTGLADYFKAVRG